MPVDIEGCLFVGACHKMHCRQVAPINRRTIYGKFFFSYSKFFESLRKLESDRISKFGRPEFDLDFESHGNVRATPREVFGLHQLANLVRSARDLLQNSECDTYRCLTGAVVTDEEDGG